jgi:hypothetical protein
MMFRRHRRDLATAEAAPAEFPSLDPAEFPPVRPPVSSRRPDDAQTAGSSLLADTIELVYRLY